MSENIKITGVDLKQFVREVYDLSYPQGLGFLHFKPGHLSDEQVEEILSRNSHPMNAVCMDYVNGRSCKMTVRREGDDLFIPSEWYDHTPYQLEELLKRCGIKACPN